MKLFFCCIYCNGFAVANSGKCFYRHYNKIREVKAESVIDRKKGSAVPTISEEDTGSAL